LTENKIKILHICETSGTGGAETVLLNIVNNLDKDIYHSSVVLFQTGWLYEKLIEKGIETYILESCRSFDLSLINRIRQIIKKFKIELVHSHLPDANAYSCLAAKLAGTPSVATYHGKIAFTNSIFSPNNIKLFLVKTLTKMVVSVSDFLKVDLTDKAGFPMAKVQTIYNGVDWKQFDNPIDISVKKGELGFKSDEILVGMVANIRPAKGYEYFIRAARLIADKKPKARFLIFGDGPDNLKQIIYDEISKLNLNGIVKIMGFREDIPDILPILDIFMLSSINEGLSIATIEAMGAGVPVVATKSGGPEEIITDGETGYLVPVRDEKSLAQKALICLKNRELSSSISQRAKAHVREKFGIENMIKQYEAVYQKCLERKNH